MLYVINYKAKGIKLLACNDWLDENYFVIRLIQTDRKKYILIRIIQLCNASKQ